MDYDRGSVHASSSRPNLSAYLAKQVLALIRERNLRPGDRLPSAKALAEHFAVATPTMREALRRLQATGVIDIRHGSGIYVRQQQERLMLSNPGYGTLETHTILQILEARLLIEPHLAELAAWLADEAAIAELERIVGLAERSLTRHDDGYYQANIQFHAAIARTAGNLVLSQIVESLTELYSSELHLVDPTRSLEEIRASDHQHHHCILAAIRDHDATRAHDAMVEHLQAARSAVAARLDQDRPASACDRGPV